MARHQVLTRLARYFHVVWMDPPREWRDWWLRGARQPPVAQTNDMTVPGFAVYRPGRWLPLLYHSALGAGLTERLRLWRARQLLQARGCRRTIMYLWRPEFARALDVFRPTTACYHITDEYPFRETEHALEESEARLIARVDQVIIHSPALLEKKGHLNPHTALIPNGVHYGAYAAQTPEPEDLRSVPRPRIGYVGFIKEQLDIPLLLTLARRHAEWSFVLIGPSRLTGADATTFGDLMQLPNVHWLGPKPVSELPAYTQHLDVGLMCYRMTDYTNYIYPLKLHEYLATGHPVVGSPIRSLLSFGNVITLARTPDEWSAALRQALTVAANAPRAVAARRRVAQDHDWDRLVARIARTLCERLGPRELARFDSVVSVQQPAGQWPASSQMVGIA